MTFIQSWRKAGVYQKKYWRGEHSRWNMSRASEKDTPAVSWLPLALLVSPRLTSGLTESLPSGLQKFSAVSLHPQSHTPLSHTHGHLSQPFWTLAQIPESKDPAASWGSLGQKDLFRKNSGVQPRAPDQSISHKEIKSWGRELLSQWWPRGFLD